MAGLKIDKKVVPRSWLLSGLCILALVIYLLFAVANGEKITSLESPGNETASYLHKTDSLVSAFVTFISNNTQTTLDDSSTSEGLLRLAGAIESIATKTGYNLQADLDKAKQCANKMTKAPVATMRATNMRKATDILCNCLQTLQQARYPELGKIVKELKNTSATISPKILTGGQKSHIKSFFGKAALLLEKMS